MRYPARQTARAPASVAIGNFDGLHRGHRAVIEAMQSIARAEGLLPTVLTFEPHPRLFFAPHTPAFRLEPVAMKLRHLKEAGVAAVALPRFDACFAALTAQQFLDEVLKTTLNAKAVITGENFAFGAKRSGTSALLREWGVREGIAVETLAPVALADGTVVSSTAIRDALTRGDMPRAALLLGRPYTLRGMVVHGDKRGASLGFPTANIAMPSRIKLPAYGVYAVYATLHGKRYDAVANLGVKPTINASHAPMLEVHILETVGSFYGQKLQVEFVAQLRPEKRFDSLAALTAQIARDCIAAKAALELGR